MFVFTFDDDGSIAELVRQWELFVRAVSGKMPGVIDEACKAGIAAAKPHIPISEARWWDATRKPGRLRKSGKSQRLRSSLHESWGEMRWSKRYASFVDKGTRGGQTITARGGRFMRFEHRGSLYHKGRVIRGSTPAANFTEHAKRVCIEKLMVGVLAAFNNGKRALELHRGGFSL